MVDWETILGESLSFMGININILFFYSYLLKSAKELKKRAFFLLLTMPRTNKHPDRQNIKKKKRSKLRK